MRSKPPAVRALLFDVFGTVVDWRGSIIREGQHLGLEPREAMMVAAHKDDLFAAQRCGLATAFVPRPLEHGPRVQLDTRPERAFDCNAGDFENLADKLVGKR